MTCYLLGTDAQIGATDLEFGLTDQKQRAEIVAMNFELFVSSIRNAAPVGFVLKNPSRGISEILETTDTKISYRRGKSKITISFDNLFKAYSSFQGQRVTSSDLKKFLPSIFDSQARPAGHSCNSTFLFTLLQHIGASGSIMGNGRKGDVFFVQIK
jgi:hypothetical protein